MPKRMKQAVAAFAALAAIGLGAAALVQASGDSGDEGKEEGIVTGTQADAAKAAALKITGGTANAVERDDAHGATWEVEITKPDGATVDIYLDEKLKFVADEGDGSEGESEGS